MSGKPNPEGVATVINLLDTIAGWDAQLADLRQRIDSDTRRADLLTAQRADAWREYREAMRKMDVESAGNTGFEARAAWFLAEMRRQVNGAK